MKIDEGYTFGRGAFETIKIVGKSPLFLEKHMARMEKALIFFEIKKDIKEIERKILEYLKENNRENYVLKIMISPENIIFEEREDRYTKEIIEKGFDLKIAKTRRFSKSEIIYHKSLNYYENIREIRKAKKENFDEVLFLNENNMVAECATANIFFIKDEILYTPKINTGLLPGTMRENIIENYKVEEIYIPIEDIDTYDSAFVSNALMGIIKVNKIEEKIFKPSFFIKDIQTNFINRFK